MTNYDMLSKSAFYKIFLSFQQARDFKRTTHKMTSPQFHIVNFLLGCKTQTDTVIKKITINKTRAAVLTNLNEQVH